jgi:fatty-acyl-CoA synthase
MQSTMQDAPLLIKDIVEHGRWIYSEKKIFTASPEGISEATFAQVADRAEQLAAALKNLGVGEGDRVATFMWNNQRHMEAYIAIPCMGAVLHTLNIRLFPEQLAYIINHADDQVIIVDATLVGALAKVRDQIPNVKHIIVAGEADASELGHTLDYETLIGAESPGYAWPEVDERSAAIMCYTSGTTGNPKGVVYSHRSTWLHSIASTSANSVALSEKDRVLLVVPMFHVNAWGVAYTAFMAGSEIIMPQMLLQGEPLLQMIQALRPTGALGVPTVWNDLLRVADATPGTDLSCFRYILAGGSAVPRSLMEAFRDRYGVQFVQGWGMTETSPLAAVSIPPAGTPPEHEMDWRVKAGRIVAGVKMRIVDDELRVLPNDGKTVGEFEIAGPWITGSYFGVDDPEKFHDGWLRTGDIGTLDAFGYLTISDRTKDVIKSGGEWISSVELEGTLIGHPDVFECAVVAIPDDKWQERPLACVVRNPESSVSAHDLHAWLADKVAKWWIPEYWTFVDSVPKTSVGKYDKKVLRARFADGELDVITI